MSDWKTYHLHLTGIVQGVGFRPTVHQFAQKRGLKGYVKNGADGLHIVFNAADLQAAQDIKEHILLLTPSLAYIEQITLDEMAGHSYGQFEIIESDQFSEQVHLAFTPDYALCAPCRQEVHDPANRRFNYPFITCTCCGPRYSIIRQLPYDRHRTTMVPYTMCKLCQTEYNDLHHRRYFSQTNSCADCGIKLSVEGKSFAGGQEVIRYVTAELQQGKIIAVKGIGGFLLLADAANPEAIRILRKRKHRPDKPLAVMCHRLEEVRSWADVSAMAEQALTSVVAPIVLLPIKPEAFANLDLAGIAPGLNSLGIMLPYAPLFELLLSSFGKPVIATSGNFSQAPVIYKNHLAVRGLENIADIILSHDRDIVLPQDDSVWRFSSRYQQKIILRRSRGMAPSFFGYQPLTGATVLATGALNKSTFAIMARQQVLISQYLGNTESVDAQESYLEVLKHLVETLQIQPEVYLADLHPQYFSTVLADEMANSNGRPLVLVQHHKAHFAAVMAEHHLISGEDAVLGVIWDGTGLGEDGQIWGGEFFIYQRRTMTRCGQLEYFPLLLGDKMAREPRLSALALGFDNPELSERLKTKFSTTEWQYYEKLIPAQKAAINTSSVGRLFDAVACLLGLADKQSYEGHAALWLENLAQNYLNHHGFNFDGDYLDLGLPGATDWSGQSILGGIADDLQDRKPADYIAAKFHYTLTRVIENVIQQTKVQQVAFSGGVFQNACLVDLLVWKLQDRCKLFFHQQLSPNDENIAYGQLVYYDQEIK